VTKSASRFFVTGAILIILAGCEDDPQPRSPYNNGNTPDLILQDFQTSWRMRDTTRYSEILSDDYRFYFDPDTRADKGLPEFWDHQTDVIQVGKIFTSNEVNDIRLTMQYSPTPLVVDGRVGWQLINVGDEFLEVELKPPSGYPEGITLVVDGQIQKFYFRKGRTEADTLASSATSSQYYIVEWRDLGVQLAVSDRLMSVRSTTWGGIKAGF
jgi:hypothetical protein